MQKYARVLNDKKESSALSIIRTTDDNAPNQDNNAWITCLLLLPYQKASGSDDSTIKIWQIINGEKEINLIRTLKSHTNLINSLAASLHDNLNQTILQLIRRWHDQSLELCRGHLFESIKLEQTRGTYNTRRGGVKGSKCQKMRRCQNWCFIYFM